jgi:hypothetical protein
MEENVFPMVTAGKSNDHVVMDPALERHPDKLRAAVRREVRG